jgi:hypothetical protein
MFLISISLNHGLVVAKTVTLRSARFWPTFASFNFIVKKVSPAKNSRRFNQILTQVLKPKSLITEQEIGNLRCLGFTTQRSLKKYYKAQRQKSTSKLASLLTMTTKIKSTLSSTTWPDTTYKVTLLENLLSSRPS